MCASVHTRVRPPPIASEVPFFDWFGILNPSVMDAESERERLSVIIFTFSTIYKHIHNTNTTIFFSFLDLRLLNKPETKLR